MSALMLPLSFDESKSESAMGSRNETGNKPIMNEVIDANLVEFEFSLNKVSFHLNAELLVSSSLHGENCSEEILGDGCSRSLFHFESCSMPTTNENENASSFPKTYYTRSSVNLDTAQRNSTINKKRRARKSQSQEAQKLAMCPSLIKYWHQRYSLFSRYDEGIKMDEESWFSVTPELIAQHHAFRCGSGTIIDCFTGVGGNAIQFAKRGSNVIAVDVDPKKIDYAQHNAIIYGVSDRIKFIKDDFFKIAPNLKGDVVFLAPPWGGPDYVKLQTYDIRSLKPRDGYQLFKIASMIAAKVVMFLPRNVNLAQLVDLSLLADPPWSLEVEQNYLCGRLKSITAYFVRPHEIRL